MASDAPRIRWARPGDAKAIGRLMHQEARLHQELLATFDLVEGFDWTRQALALIGRSGVRVAVAEHGDDVVGFVYGRLVGEDATPGAGSTPPPGLRRLVRSLLHRFRAPRANAPANAFQAHPRGIIEDCWVEPLHRRQGLARRMVLEVLEWMASRQVSRVELNVVVANAGAVAFWRGLGFEPLRYVLHKTVR